MLFSVIVPVYNEKDNINRLIYSLLNLKFDDGEHELIIVDNNSSDETLSVLLQYEGKIKAASENKQGSYAARNRGINKSSGAYLCFTDGDCAVDENWLLKAQETIERGDPDLIAGKVINTEPKKNLYAIYDDLCFLKQDQMVKRKSAATANLIVSREVFEVAGMFDAEMMTGGDKEFTKRAVNQGFKLVYNDQVIVYHKSRSSFSDIRKKLSRFWLDSKKFKNTLKKISGLCLMPGIKTLTRAAINKEIGFITYLQLLAVSFFLGLSVSIQVLFGKN